MFLVTLCCILLIKYIWFCWTHFTYYLFFPGLNLLTTYFFAGLNLSIKDHLGYNLSTPRLFTGTKNKNNNLI